MSKKPNKAVEAKTNTLTLMDRIPNNRGEWLMLCIKLTKRAITHPNLESQAFLVVQVERMRTQLKEWKKTNPNEELRDIFQ